MSFRRPCGAWWLVLHPLSVLFAFAWTACASLPRAPVDALPASSELRPSPERVEAWLAAGQPERALDIARELLELAPMAPLSHIAYVDASFEARGVWRLAEEYRELAASEDPCRHVLGLWGLWRGDAPTRRPQHLEALERDASACVDDGPLLLALAFEAQGQAPKVLLVLGDRLDPPALESRLRALVAMGRRQEAETLFLDRVHGGLVRVDVGLGLVEGNEGRDRRSRANRVLLSLARDVLRSAASGSDFDEVFRAWKLYSTARKREEASEAAHRLSRIEADLSLPNRLPWGNSMVQSIGRALLASGGSVDRLDASPRERAAVAREILKKKRMNAEHSEIQRAFEQAVTLDPLAFDLRLEEAEWLLDQATGHDASKRRARARALVDEALDGISVFLVTSPNLEPVLDDLEKAMALRVRLAEDTEVETAPGLPRPDDPAEAWAERARAMEGRGLSEAALGAWARAAVLGDEAAREALVRLYRGPASVEALLGAARRGLDRPLPRVRESLPRNPSRDELLSAFEMTSTTGALRLTTLRGGVIVVAFWASWCAPCIEEIPQYALLVERLRQEGLRVELVTISVDDTEKAWRRGIAALGKPAVHLAWAPELARKLEIPSIPSTWVLDADGRVREIHQGWDRHSLERLESEIRGILAGPRNAG